MGKFSHDEMLRKIREKAAEAENEVEHDDADYQSGKKGWPDAENLLRPDTHWGDFECYTAWKYGDQLIVTLVVKRDELDTDEEWDFLKKMIITKRDILKRWIIEKKTGYGDERLKQLEKKCLKNNARKMPNKSLNWDGVIVRFSELHRSVRSSNGSRPESRVNVPLKYLHPMVKSKVGQNVLGEKWGNKMYIERVPRADDKGWYGVISHRTDKLVRITAYRDGMKPTDPVWRKRLYHGEKFLQMIYEMMMKSSNVYGEEWLAGIRKQCLDLGARETGNRPLIWEGVFVHFVGLY